MARFSTHVLDTSRGRPAQGVAIDLHTLTGTHVTTATTDADGRIDVMTLEPGIYQLTFHAGSYFRANGIALADPPFLDQIVIRFGIADPDGKYHVPLLLSPYGYSTYRGS